MIVDVPAAQVELVDLEDMYGTELAPIDGYPQGTDGYQHPASRVNRTGQWCTEGDRFAGAVLLAEMLAWHEERVRQVASGESYFAAREEQQVDIPRYRVMVDVLEQVSPNLARLFRRAWESATLADCPTLGEWAYWISCLHMGGLPAPRLAPLAWADVGQFVHIEWSAVSNAQCYDLEVMEDDNSQQDRLYRSAYSGSLCWHDVRQRRAGTFRYRVRAAVWLDGLTSSWSNSETLVVGLRPTKSPANVKTHLIGLLD
jgi:hypothetical protein